MQVISIQNIQDRPIIDAIAPDDFLLIGDVSDGNIVKRVLASEFTVDDNKLAIADYSWTTLPDKPSTFPPSSHGHSTSDISGLSDHLWNKVIKSSDSARTSTTLASDTELIIPVVTAGWFEFKLYLLIDCTAGTGGFRFALNLPVGAFGNWNARNSGNTALSNGSNSNVASSVILAANSVARQIVEIKGLAYAELAGSQIGFQYAQNAAGNTTTVKSSSRLFWKGEH